MLGFSLPALSQTGIGTTSPDASAQLDVSSTTKGFLPPRMTEAERDAISSPADGLVIYQTDGAVGLHVRYLGSWVKIDGTNATNVAAAGAVMNTGDETIGGVKTFSSTIVGNLSGNVSGNSNTVTNGVYTTSSVTALSDISDAGSGAIITSFERSKLNSISNGAEPNVQINWNAISGDAAILNKPSIQTSNFYLGQDTLGGIVFYIYRNAYGEEHGLICSKYAQDGMAYHNSNSLFQANRDDDGVYNTNVMIADGNSPIANWVNDHNNGLNTSNSGFSDWYIPSLDEMLLISSTRFITNKVLRNLYDNGDWDVDDWGIQTTYWTSTTSQYNSSAHTVDREGVGRALPTYAAPRLRVIRAF